ncbi:hypothetical protein H5410_027541 [Solanum commersonii]|uniref:Uncharacterized protein n=1 Tax=Solanum commersonii TaxID=4109 RepID=A0A9J5YZG9_SOLCO|nr:hypothetical protein H5410_027541 [Solanum commersonii]
MDHHLWMYNMHYETGAGLKLEFINESDGLDGMFYNSMHVDVYNMVAPDGQIRVEQVRVEHDRVHEMINDSFGVQSGMESEQYFDETPNEEGRRFYDQFDVELETTLQHPQYILEELSDDEILNVEEEISENEEN